MKFNINKLIQSLLLHYINSMEVFTKGESLRVEKM